MRAHVPLAPRLDVILAITDLAPREHDDALVVQRGHDVVPLGHPDQPLLKRRLGPVEHIVLDRVEEVRDGGGHAVEREGRLGASVPPHGDGVRLLDVLGAELEPDGDALRA
jgi:hypothetical protein